MRYLFFFVFVLCGMESGAQKAPGLIDSLKKKLAQARTGTEKVDLHRQLAFAYLSIDTKQSDAHNAEMLAVAELSRDRKLMIKARLHKGERLLYMTTVKSNLRQATAAYEEALEMARHSKLDEQVAAAYLGLSNVHVSLPDLDKALAYCNQANSYIGTLQNDSLKAVMLLHYGSVYNRRREKLLALRSYLAAQRLAETLENRTLQLSSYSQLASFYAGLEDYDRSIDLLVKALDAGSRRPDADFAYIRASLLNRIGTFYTQKKDYDMAARYFGHIIRLADTIDYAPLKLSGYVGILNNYLESDKPKEALEYFNQSTDLKTYLNTFGLSAIIDQAYGYIYTDLRQFDSAAFYYKRAASHFEQSESKFDQYSYYNHMGRLYKRAGDGAAAIRYYTKANAVSGQTADLKLMQATAAELDTLYQQSGDYKQARLFAALQARYKDSLDKLGREKDLMQMEADDEQQRQDRMAREQEEAKRKRHSIQYTGITVAITAVFVLLAMMGFFRVSARAVKMIGYFAFLMFFEFLFLILKKKIALVTHGEPWKDLLFMIGLAAVLLPLHHLLEEKAIHYLTSRKKMRLDGGVQGIKKLFHPHREEPVESFHSNS